MYTFRVIHKVIIKHRHKNPKEKRGIRYCLKMYFELMVHLFLFLSRRVLWLGKSSPAEFVTYFTMLSVARATGCRRRFDKVKKIRLIDFGVMKKK